ncbi:protein VAPYRIN-like [Phoenix dactylifera]|uniref:Protein VAPYRIN-like n=1 Tax=Phoenix dactylifera TaxID=42345 RepID=A0A8B7CRK8_PHODC|nr:protein VAPYRIN-like [Phoenix dactylifera]
MAAVGKLVEVAETEVVIEFKTGVKCRSDLHLQSLHPTAAVTFKVQTSAPHKFHVNPPNGVLPPLSSAVLQVILRPQPLPPPSFPRSPSDRFLIKASLSASFDAAHDTRLKVAYVGPFLLRHAAALGDAAAVRHLLRRQPSLLPRLPPADSAALLRSADPSLRPLLLDSGLHLPPSPSSKPLKEKPNGEGEAAASTPRGWTAVHAAAAAGEHEELLRAIEEWGVDARDGEGRTALHAAAGRGHVRCARALVERGAEKNARSGDGRTALYRAAVNGDAEMVAALLEMRADASIATARGRTPLDVARDKGHLEVVEILERGEMVMTASRRGDLGRLESLLKKRIGVHGHDQYGMTALHSAAIKGHRDVVSLLIEFGMEMECQDVEGHTPLHLAVEGGHLETVQLLIDMGANIDAKTKRGATPYLMATSMGYDAMSQLLLSRGATSSSCIASSSSSATSRN